MDSTDKGAASLWNAVRESAKGVSKEGDGIDALLAAIDAADPVLGHLRDDRAEVRGVTYDHTAACIEVVGWRQTGLYEGEALKSLSNALPPSLSGDSMRAAELQVISEALRRCAALRRVDGAPE